MKVSLLWIWFLCIVGNFLYQMLNGNDWSAATERSFFQGVALLIVFFHQAATRVD